MKNDKTKTKPNFSDEQLAYLKQAVDYLLKEFGERELTAEDDQNTQQCLAFQDAQTMTREVFDGLYKQEIEDEPNWVICEQCGGVLKYDEGHTCRDVRSARTPW